MARTSFDYLVNLLRPKITINRCKSLNSTGDPNHYCTPKMVVMASLRILGGEEEKSMEDIFGPRRVSIDRIFTLFLKACFNTRILWPKLPETREELTALAMGFHAVSDSKGVCYGVCGCVDGFMIPIDKPSLEVSRDYWSEHYKMNAINTQCMYGPDLWFIYTNFVAPGKTGDNWLCRLARPELGKDFFILADAAYPLTDYTQIPFIGRNLTEDQRDYNYFLSQQRICIEMAFGRLTSKFRILQSNMSFDLYKVKRIFLVCCMLHNFVIDNDAVDEDLLGGDFQQEVLPYAIVDQGLANDPLATSSARRNVLLQMIHEDGELTRPLHNRLRNDNNVNN